MHGQPAPLIDIVFIVKLVILLGVTMHRGMGQSLADAVIIKQLPQLNKHPTSFSVCCT